MRKFFARHLFLRKLLASLGLVLIFLLGRKIPVPQVAFVKPDASFTSAHFYLTGATISQVGLFSLGLGPMMYGMLLSQLFNLGKRAQTLSPKVVEFRKNLLVLIVAIIQGLTLAIGLSYGDVANPVPYILEVTLVLVAGAIIVAWLCQLNAAFGMGGTSLLMLVSMLSGQFSNIPLAIQIWKSPERPFLIGFGIWVLVTIYLIVLFEKSEYRIPLQRISIHNKYSKHSYLPIRVNIAGGMALMYAYSFLSFPTYILLLLAWLFPHWSWIQEATRWFSLTTFSGVLFYFAMIVFLTILLAFVNVDVVNLAEGLRNSGDYIPHVRPGMATRDYLSKYVRFFAYFNAVYLVLLAGVPMLISLRWPVLYPLAGMVGVVMMTAGILLQVLEEWHVMALRKQYKSLFD